MPLLELESANRNALEILLTTVSRRTKDWERYYRDAILFHRRNAESWANDATGRDLADQIDPEFSMSAAVAAMSNKGSLSEAA